ANGTKAGPAYSLSLGPERQLTQDLSQIFVADPGAVSIVVETSSLTVIGDVTISDASPGDRYRASVALTSAPQTSLVIPYVVIDGTSVVTLGLSNTAATAATAKLTLMAPDGSTAGSTTAKIPAHGSFSGALSTLFAGPPPAASLATPSEQPRAGAALIDPKVRHGPLVPALLIPGAPTAAAAPAISVAASLDFGSVTVGQTKSATLTVTNTGTAALS